MHDMEVRNHIRTWNRIFFADCILFNTIEVMGRRRNIESVSCWVEYQILRQDEDEFRRTQGHMEGLGYQETYCVGLREE